MNERTLDPPDLGPSLDLSRLDGTGSEELRVTWALADGRRVVVKSATGRHRARMRREAEALRGVAGPGVVDLLAVRDDEERTSLVLADAGHRTLADPGELGSDALLRSLTRTCEAVDRLHGLGWSHGRLEPRHVVVGPRGRVQLCSFSSARPIGSPSDTSTDLTALLELCRTVAEELEGRDRHDARSGRRLHALLAELEGAPDADAARIAAALASLRRTPAPRRLARVPASRALRTTAVSTALAGIGTLVALAFPGDGSADPIVDSVPRARPVDTLARTPLVPQATAPPAVVLDGRTYRVGLPGDRVAAGDWDCDGTTTVRLLRPTTGELFEFGPPDPTGPPTTAQLRSVHPGAIDLIAESRTGVDGCHRSVLLGPDDRREEIP